MIIVIDVDEHLKGVSLFPRSVFVNAQDSHPYVAGICSSHNFSFVAVIILAVDTSPKLS